MSQQTEKVPNILRICADQILQRMEFMGSGVYLSVHDFEEMSEELEVILNELVSETMLDRQELIDFCADNCDMEK
jgi:hypothetical protein